MIRKTCLLATLLLPTTALNAATIILVNGNFQGGVNDATDLDPNGWTTSAEGANNVYAIAGTSPITSTVLHFKDNSGATFSSISQNLSTPDNLGLTAGSYNNYTVTLDLGWRNDRINGGAATGDATLRFELYDVTTPSTVYGFTDFTLVQRATPLFNTYALIHDDLEINITNTALSSNSNEIGLRILRIDADNTGTEGDSTMWMDNITLTAIPEPSAALLGGLGMLCLLRRRRN